MYFVSVAEPPEDADGVLHVRRLYHHGLEPPLERGILLDVPPVLVQRRRADAVQLAPRERRLEHVGSVDGAFGGPCAHEGMELVDEEDDGPLGGGYLLQDGLEPLLELSAVLGAGHQGSHVEGEDPPVPEVLGHVALGDPARETLDDGRLAHARLAEQHRIVLPAPAQDLHHPSDLVVPPYHGIELLLPRKGREIAGVSAEGVVVVLCVLGGDPRGAPDLGERPQEVVRRDAGAPQERRGGPLLGKDGEEQVLDGHEVVLQL